MPSALRLQFTAIGPRRNARALNETLLEARLDKFTKTVLEDVVSVTRVYPPEVEGSRYVRTNTLFNAWRVTKVPSYAGIQWQITNAAYDRSKGVMYARWVHGPSRQLPFHRQHGWLNVGDVLEALGGRGQYREGVQLIINSYFRELDLR